MSDPPVGTSLDHLPGSTTRFRFLCLGCGHASVQVGSLRFDEKTGDVFHVAKMGSQKTPCGGMVAVQVRVASPTPYGRWSTFAHLNGSRVTETSLDLMLILEGAPT